MGNQIKKKTWLSTMDAAFGICGRDWMIVVTDTNVNRSIFTLTDADDKIMQLGDHTVMAATGEHTDRYMYTNLMLRNLKLNQFRTGHVQGLDATANFLRNQM